MRIGRSCRHCVCGHYESLVDVLRGRDPWGPDLFFQSSSVGKKGSSGSGRVERRLAKIYALMCSALGGG